MQSRPPTKEISTSPSTSQSPSSSAPATPIRRPLPIRPSTSSANPPKPWRASPPRLERLPSRRVSLPSSHSIIDRSTTPRPSPHPINRSTTPRDSQQSSPTPVGRSTTPSSSTSVLDRSSTAPTVLKKSPTMSNFQGYLDSSQAGPSNPRPPPSPQQQQQQQNMSHGNGVNGGMAVNNGMVGFPTPAGHQSDLNYVMQMVEELSGVLRANQQLTSSVVDKVGKVKERAKNMNLTNDEMIAAAATELNEDSQNLEKENSELRKALEKAEYDKKENWKLAIHGANILADISEKMHAYKAQHEIDTLAWHKNYRAQLLQEREENLGLRNHINDMIAAAARANGHLRDLRRYLTDNDELHQLRVKCHQYRLERRQWKRMALPLIPDDDSEWSDDDDLIDPEEKKRQQEAEAAKAEAEAQKEVASA